MDHHAALSKAVYPSTELVEPMSSVTRVDVAATNVGELASRIRSLSDRLVGAVPQAIGEVAQPVSGTTATAIFYGLELSAKNIERHVSDAMGALDRIERALP